MRIILIFVVLLLAGCVSQPLPKGFKGADEFDPVAAAKTRISLGLTYLKNGNYSQAKFNLDKALQFAPRLADAHYSIAYYYQLVGENELAEQSYQDAMDFDPRNPDIANTYGAFLCQQGKYEKAKSFFLKAVNSNNYVSTAETFENLALCSQSQGQVDDAIQYLQNAINHQPTRGKSLLLLTQLYAAQEQWLQARDTLRKYERVASVSAETLWLSVKIEQALGNMQTARGYGDMLVAMYPGHPNTQDYLKKRQQRASSAASERVTTKVADSATASADIATAKPDVIERKPEPFKPEPQPFVPEPAEVAQGPEVGEQATAAASDDTLADETAAKVEQPADAVVEDAEQPTDVVERQPEPFKPEPQPVVPETAEVAQGPEVEEAAAASDGTLADESAATAEQSGDAAVEDAEQQTVVAERQPEPFKPEPKPFVPDPAPSTQAEQAETVESEGAEQPLYHTVAKNENLYRISLLYNLKMARLIEWNNLSDASAIRPGMRLYLVDPNTLEQE
ncbi:type IV pilus biogenesis/stability protein PilW [Aestuariibacter halophilus]|uniref:Type IV pilus biogenesis/stability protein PilW n=1 Tax=Fluctibacter halophilus TaxID=226011 RepID=A0ABS8G300_9ALTE|nr:type IV pilus biogenesis/stability protein PilW [Aestuariibacter halophilus]MCC2614954.1 type IV pilus biogenesis/stability protein PilW [Aestuariibacter halophilus]